MLAAPLVQIVLLPELDIRNDDDIKRAISRSNVVVNCVGLRLETRNFTFQDVHVDFPKRLAKWVQPQSPGWAGQPAARARGLPACRRRRPCRCILPQPLLLPAEHLPAAILHRAGSWPRRGTCSG